jgi:hypothetical protein
LNALEAGYVLYSHLDLWASGFMAANPGSFMLENGPKAFRWGHVVLRSSFLGWSGNAVHPENPNAIAPNSALTPAALGATIVGNLH